MCSVQALPSMRLPQYFPWPELLLSDCGIKVSFAIFYIPEWCQVLAEGRLSVCLCALLGLRAPGCLRGHARRCRPCRLLLHGGDGERRAGESPASQLAGWAAQRPPTQTDFQDKNFTPTTYLNFPRILSDRKIGIKINTTARGFRHLALPQHQAGGCLQKGWPQNVTEIPA